MLETQHAQQVEDVLREVLPEQCRKIGRTNLRDIARSGGDIHFVTPNNGSLLDFHTLLPVVAAAAAILAHSLSALKNISERKKKGPEEISVEVKVKLPAHLAEKLDPEVTTKLVDTLVRLFKD